MYHKFYLFLTLAITQFYVHAMNNWQYIYEAPHRYQSRIIQLRKTIIELINETPNFEHVSQDSLLLDIARYDELSDLVELMLKRKANPNVTDDAKYTPLYYAVCDGCLKNVLLLLQAGANAHQNYGHFGETVLFQAIRNSNLEIIYALLAHGANPNDKDRYLNTALTLTLYVVKETEMRKKIVVLLLRYAALPLGESNFPNALHVSYNLYRNALRDAQLGRGSFNPDDPIFCHDNLNDHKAIAQLLICNAGLYSKQGRIAKQGLAQVLPLKIAQRIATNTPTYAIS